MQELHVSIHRILLLIRISKSTGGRDGSFNTSYITINPFTLTFTEAVIRFQYIVYYY